MDAVQKVLQRCLSFHIAAASEWAKTEQEYADTAAAAHQVRIARATTHAALETGAKAADLSPEAREAIDAHCRDAEALAAVEWHLCAASDMADALGVWKKKLEAGNGATEA